MYLQDSTSQETGHVPGSQPASKVARLHHQQSRSHSQEARSIPHQSRSQASDSGSQSLAISMQLTPTSQAVCPNAVYVLTPPFTPISNQVNKVRIADTILN